MPAVSPEMVQLLPAARAARRARGPQTTCITWHLPLPQIREKKKRHVLHLRQKVRRDEGAPERCGNDTKGRKAPAAAGDAAGDAV
mgnify:CR=1 FL=1